MSDERSDASQGTIAVERGGRMTFFVGLPRAEPSALHNDEARREGARLEAKLASNAPGVPSAWRRVLACANADCAGGRAAITQRRQSRSRKKTRRVLNRPWYESCFRHALGFGSRNR